MKITNANNQQLAASIKIGEAANAAYTENLFADYMSRKATNTNRRYQQALNLFGAYLVSIGFENQGMTEQEEWRGMTFGLIESYKAAMIKKGYSIPTVNQTTYIIKAFAGLAGQAGIIPADESVRIKAIKGYKSSEAAHVDEQRAAAGLETRIGTKKPKSTSITPQQAKALKQQPDTLRGRRDALLMALLLEHGARISEVVSLTGSSFDMERKTVTFYRQKTNRTDTHRMTKDTAAAATAYLERFSMKPEKSIWIGINKAGKQAGTFGRLAAQKTVSKLGAAIGLDISAHDCRHYYATAAHRGGTDMLDIMRAGGWSSPAMVTRYVDNMSIGNINVRLG